MASNRYAARENQSSATRDRLNEELSSGAPILYRRIPGTRRYYNPDVGITVDEKGRQGVSEHYVLNYRRNLSIEQPASYNDLTTRTRSYRTRNIRLRYSMAETYALKQNADNSANMSAQDALSDPTFDALVYRMTEIKAQLVGKFGPERDAITNPNGEYANILTQLGRRLENQADFVGQSPDGWITTNVIPALIPNAVTPIF